ncbi:MAG: transporter substrate-binding protein [Hyphomicrobiales bacterium]|nr:transporter substrate-binding protein [Hyphomicrobiales bacterium]
MAIRTRTFLFGVAVLALLGACTPAFDFGASTLSPAGRMAQNQPGNMPAAAGETFGTGPVRVALLLPLSGDPGIANVGISMANASRLAVEFVTGNPKIGDNITIVLKDTGVTSGGAAQRAQEAVNEGASLILGPLKADQVSAAGAVARSAGIPLIGFSNNTGAAAPGIYLLNVLPEVEARRSLSYVKAKGRQAVAGIFPTSSFGKVQQGAFQQATADLGLTPRAVYTFSSEAEARSVIDQMLPQLKSGAIDALFIPDRATAPSFAALLAQAGVPKGNVTIIGSADWEGDSTILQAPYLAGAVYPAVDDTGYQALKPEYQAKFGSVPHPLATIAYTATILANVSALSKGTPRYDRTQLTSAGGFNGRDGVFRFLPNGRSEYALIMKQVAAGGAQRIDGPKL